jgi:hypothetical protein
MNGGADVGSTDLDRLALLCVEHHHEPHRRDQRLLRRKNGTWAVVDAGSAVKVSAA